MKKHNYVGLFISFEGLDGAGSSTQASKLVERLNNFGFYSYLTKEPTNNLIGGLIRAALTKSWQASPECMQLLYAADRAHHLKREIIPALEKGNIIVSDRYYLSSIAFGSLNSEKKWLIDINEQFILPDVTFFIDVSAENCIKRIHENRNEFELFEEKNKLVKVQKTYKNLAKSSSDIISINGERLIEIIGQEIFLQTKKLLKKRSATLKRRVNSLFAADI